MLPSSSSCWSVLIFLARMSSGDAGAVAKHVCLDDSVQMFQNIDLARGPVVLYKNGARDTIIATWYMQASTLNSSVVPQYKGKVSLDEYGNIWMKHVQHSDEANYCIIYEPETLSIKLEARIIVMVAPDSRCKPKIIRGVDTLITSPDSDVCGQPAASAYWLQKPSITAERNVIKLLPGQGAGTVYACIDSPAFRCANNSKLSDYCTVFEDDSRTQSNVPLGSTISTVTLLILLVILLIVSIIIWILTRQHKLLRSDNAKEITQLKRISDELPLMERISSHDLRSMSNDSGMGTHCPSSTG